MTEQEYKMAIERIEQLEEQVSLLHQILSDLFEVTAISTDKVNDIVTRMKITALVDDLNLEV